MIIVRNNYVQGRKVYIDRTVYCREDEKELLMQYEGHVLNMGGDICRDIRDADVIFAHQGRTVFDEAYNDVKAPVLSHYYVNHCIEYDAPMPAINYLVAHCKSNHDLTIVEGGVGKKMGPGLRAIILSLQGDNVDNHQANNNCAARAPNRASPPVAGPSAQRNPPQQAAATGSTQVVDAADGRACRDELPPMLAGPVPWPTPLADPTVFKWAMEFVVWYMRRVPKNTSETSIIRGTSALMSTIVPRFSTHTFDNGIRAFDRNAVKQLIIDNKNRAGDTELPTEEIEALVAESRRRYLLLLG